MMMASDMTTSISDGPNFTATEAIGASRKMRKSAPMMWPVAIDPREAPSAWSALPALAMRCPSNITATALPPPGMPTRMEVIEPPKPTPV
ncbi:hypothetical protein D3C83_127910 [compost metagenome]